MSLTVTPLPSSDASQPKLSLNDLPDELLLRLLQWLDIPELFSTSRVFIHLAAEPASKHHVPLPWGARTAAD